jgi:N-acetylglucosaminyl-diphospho-decaprenol L-rhamnosyltransferase
VADVAVVIVTKDSRDDLGRNLDELRAQAGLELELVVVDNGSTDGTLDLLAARPDVRVIANGENRWLAPAWMQGVRATDAPYVLFLTPDTALPARDAVSRLRAALEADPAAALAGPLLFDEAGGDLLNGSYSFPSVAWIVLTSLGVGRRRLLEKPPSRAVAPAQADVVEVTLLNGACMLAQRSALDAVGGLDERYRLYYEEVDLAKRLRAAGSRILLVRTVRAVHRGKGSPAAPGLREAAYAHGERIYFRTHHGRAGALAVRAARAVAGTRRIPT